MARKLRDAAEWWPPKVGDKLRENAWPEYLMHVIGVVPHLGREIVVVAYWGKHKHRWFYEVIRSIETTHDRYSMVRRARRGVVVAARARRSR